MALLLSSVYGAFYSFQYAPESINIRMKMVALLLSLIHFIAPVCLMLAASSSRFWPFLLPFSIKRIHKLLFVKCAYVKSLNHLALGFFHQFFRIFHYFSSKLFQCYILSGLSSIEKSFRSILTLTHNIVERSSIQSISCDMMMSPIVI